MSASLAASCFFTLLVTLFLLRPIRGLMADAFKVMLKLASFSLFIHLLPFEWIDNWSKEAVGWTQVGAKYVPLICFVLLVGMSIANIPGIQGTMIEVVLKLLLYVIGGVFAVGNVNWINMEQAARNFIISFIALVESIIAILKDGTT